MKYGRKLTPYLYFLPLLAALAFNLWKLPLGFGDGDEAFYLTIPARLLRGDALLADEWHLSQFSGLLLYPLMLLRSLFTDSSDGVVMYFRYCYLAAQFLTSALIYFYMSKLSNRLAATLAAALFMLFCPYQIYTLSYNTMGLMSFTLAFLSYIYAPRCKTGKSRVFNLAFSGFMYACSVLCSPALAVLFAPFTLWSVIRKDKGYWCFLCGVLLPAVLTIGFILSRAGFSVLIRNLPFILNDPEHQDTPFTYGIGYFIRNQFAFTHKITLIPVVWGFIISCAVLLCGKFTLRAKYNASVSGNSIKICAFAVISLSAAASSLLMLRYATVWLNDYDTAKTHIIVSPFIAVGFVAWLCCRRRDVPLFVMYCGGVVYGFILTLTSNQMASALAMPHIISAVASVKFVSDFIAEQSIASRGGQTAMENLVEPPNARKPILPRKPRICLNIKGKNLAQKLIIFCSAIVILSLFANIADTKLFHSYRDQGPLSFRAYPILSDLGELDTEITAGPLKGIVTTAERADEYQRIYADFISAVAYTENSDFSGSTSVQNNGNTVGGAVKTLIISQRTWLYLCDDTRFAAPSAWLPFLSGEDVIIDRLREYYAVREIRPQIVYVEEPQFIEAERSDGTISAFLAELGDYAKTVTDAGFVFRLKTE